MEIEKSPAKSGRKKIGLALGGGAARGMAHIGVLEVLHKDGIPIDMIAGTSAGAVIGAIYAWSQDIAYVKKEALEMNWRKIAPLIDPSLPRSGLIKGKKIQKLLASYIGGNTRFSDLKIPFVCVATDIDTGEEVILNQGSVSEALRASISIPGIFTVVKREGRHLVDGGLTTPVPVKAVKQMGADFIIGVNVMSDIIHRIGSKGKEPNIFQIMAQSLYITTYSVARSSVEDADIVIEPELAHISAADFQKAEELIWHGAQAAQKAIPEIKKPLKLP